MADQLDTNSGDEATGEAVAIVERLARLMRSAEHEVGLNPAQWEALRYLARCNRFSNAPSALAEYLAATKGTISQTVNALQRKGLVEKAKRPNERRSVALSLTEAGWKILDEDPWIRLAQHEASLDKQTRDHMRIGLRVLLRTILSHNHIGTFGLCVTCRHFRSGETGEGGGADYRCQLLDCDLSQDDAQRICVHHETPQAAGAS